MTAKPTQSSRATMRRLAVGSAIAAALLAGTAAEAAPRKAVPAGEVTRLLAKGQPEDAITLGEKALAAKPQDATLRAALGQAYLHSGRFTSAAAALGDAVSLGDASGRTALGLALAQVASGQSHDAVATLDHAVTAIPAGDLGLAYALAGESARGVSILSEAVRTGGATAKLRQNLAYAYALDGRWTEARVTATMDVPADQIDSRLEQWAMSMRAGAEQERIATLLGVKPRDDSGMPAALALNAAPEPAPVPAAALATAELPATTEVASAPTPAPEAAPAATPAPAEFAAAAPAPAPVDPTAAAAPAPATATTELAALTPAPAPAAVVSVPVVQPLPAPAAKPVRAVKLAAGRPAKAEAADGSHVVQLGAFSSAKNAERAVAFYSRKNPQIAGHKLVVSQAKVHGRLFWRVAAAGFDAAGAHGACSQLRQSGSACFAHAVTDSARTFAATAPASAKVAVSGKVKPTVKVALTTKDRPGAKLARR